MTDDTVCDRCGEVTPRDVPTWRCLCCPEPGASVVAHLAQSIAAFEWVEPGRPHLPVASIG